MFSRGDHFVLRPCRKSNPGRRLAAGLLVIGLALAGSAGAHTDLLLQIDMLTRDIEARPEDPNLYLRRGSLFRRHENWPAAAADFRRVRKLDPQNAEIDWYEGHLWLDAGDYERSEQSLSRYLRNHPDNPVALHQRARSRNALGRHEDAADDYRLAVAASETPGPPLYSGWVLALVAAGEAFFPQARQVAARGLAAKPGEVGLLGLATDLDLAQSETVAAAAEMAVLPPRVLALPQWRFRSGLRVCLDGDIDAAARMLRALAGEAAGGASSRAGTWLFPLGSLQELAGEPTPEACRDAALQQLRKQAE